MDSASGWAKRGLLAAWLLAALLLTPGCARTAGRPAGAPSAHPPGPSGEAPARTPAPTGPAAAGGAPRQDPSEVMTPDELAAIPDPVPGGGEVSQAPRPGTRTAPPPEATASGDTAGAMGGADAPEPPPPADHSIGGPAGVPGGVSGGFLWRVQIFASPELALADRVAKEASRRLGVSYVIQYGEKLYKVRLGAFATEDEAQLLRGRAVREGFPGAFRVRSEAEATDGKN